MDNLKELACVINKFRIEFLSFNAQEFKNYLIKQNQSDYVVDYLIHKGIVQITYGLCRFIEIKKPIHFLQLVDLDCFISSKKQKTNNKKSNSQFQGLTEELALEFLKSKGYLIYKKI